MPVRFGWPGTSSVSIILAKGEPVLHLAAGTRTDARRHHAAVVKTADFLTPAQFAQKFFSGHVPDNPRAPPQAALRFKAAGMCVGPTHPRAFRKSFVSSVVTACRRCNRNHCGFVVRENRPTNRNPVSLKRDRRRRLLANSRRRSPNASRPLTLPTLCAGRAHTLSAGFRNSRWST